MSAGMSRSALVGLLLNGLYALLVLALSLVVFVFFLRTSQIGVNGKATFEKVLTGTAFRPYVYRQLLPITANLLAPSVDGLSALRLGRRMESVLGERLFRAQLNGRLYPRQVLLIMAIMYISLVGFAAIMRVFLRDLGYNRRLQYLVPPLALLASAVNFNFGYMYDFTQILLFTGGLWLMYRRIWAAYLVVFALAVLNKETTVFLLLIFALYFYDRVRRTTWLVLCSAQLGIYALVQAAIRYRFRLNPGAALEWHLPDQLAAYADVFSNSPWLLFTWVVAVGLIAVGVIWRWVQKPLFARYALIPLPFLFVLWILWGWPFELRNLMEMQPVLLILLLPPPTGVPAESPNEARRPQRTVDQSVKIPA